MRNIVGPFKNTILRQYDLKGSTQNRKELINPDDDLSKMTLKDLNFDELENKIYLSKKDTSSVENQIEEDTFMLAESDLMDYSMLLTIACPENLQELIDLNVFNKLKSGYIRRSYLNPGNIKNLNNNDIPFKKNNEVFEKNDKQVNLLSSNSNEHEDNKLHLEHENSNENKDRRLLSESDSKVVDPEKLKHYQKYIYLSTDKKKVYILAIIDYLQVYHFLKALETNYKFFVKRPKTILSISCVPPDIYQDRFMKYIEKSLINYDNDEDIALVGKVSTFDENYKNMVSMIRLCPNCGTLIGNASQAQKNALEGNGTKVDLWGHYRKKNMEKREKNDNDKLNVKDNILLDKEGSYKEKFSETDKNKERNS
jgi:hypothetical protein